jgi:hypothetical protein
LRPQVLVLGARESKHEVGREAMGITSDLLIQPLHRNPIKLSQIHVEDDFVIAENEDLGADSFGKNDGGFIHKLKVKLEVAKCDLKIH